MSIYNGRNGDNVLNLKLILTITFFFLLKNNSFAQSKVLNKYDYFSHLGDSLYRVQQPEKAIIYHNLAIKANNGMAKVIHRYNLASCYSLQGKIDSAFIQLDRIIEKVNFSGHELISLDRAFFNLHNDSRWQPLLKRVEKNYLQKNKNN